MPAPSYFWWTQFCNWLWTISECAGQVRIRSDSGFLWATTQNSSRLTGMDCWWLHIAPIRVEPMSLLIHAFTFWRQTKAQEARVGNDANWQDPETTQRLEKLEKLQTKSYWTRLKLSDGFFDQLKNVLPFFCVDSMPTSKTAVMSALGAHILLIGKIADKTVENSITTTDLSRLNRVDILAEFIKLDKATSLSDAQTAVQKRQQVTSALLASRVEMKWISTISVHPTQMPMTWRLATRVMMNPSFSTIKVNY
jgi:hypothetical protein